jgi:hypothetical protein
MGGSAGNGIDYGLLAGSVLIPAGATSALVILAPIDDVLVEGEETAVATLSASTTYTVAAASTAIITLLDNDSHPTSPTLAAAGSVWKYLDDGSNQGTAWQTATFDDSTWQSGPAQLGYGDGDEATVVGFGPNPAAKYLTTYFRRTFTVADASLYTSLTLKVKRDDGVVVYLNGTEVFRSNMKTGPVSHTTTASPAAADDGNEWQSVTLSPAFLINGTNLLAAEVHQASANNSDLSFDLELAATIA